MDRLTLHGAPFPFGFTFVPPDVLAGLSGRAGTPAEVLAGACEALRASFAFVPCDEPWAEEAAEVLRDVAIAVLWVIPGPLWPIIERRGAMEGLRATLTRPDEIGAELDDGLDLLLREVGRGVRLGARGIVLAEDLAGAEGPLVAPDFAIAELVPRYERIVRAADALEIPAVLHSDGDIRPLLAAITKAGFVAVHAGGGLGLDAFERLFWAARDADLAVIGGLLTAELGNPARAEALGSTVGVLAKTGGLFVADDGGITTAQEAASLVTALAAARSA